MSKKKRSGWEIAGEAVMLLLCAVFFIPFYYLLVNTFKSSQEATFSPMSLPIRSFTLEHYAEAFASSNFLRSFVNSLLITVISVIIIIVFGSMAAYVIARRQNRLTKLLFLYFLLGFMVPAQTTCVIYVSGIYWGCTKGSGRGGNDRWMQSLAAFLENSISAGEIGNGDDHDF